jgi:hypothetical protein
MYPFLIVLLTTCGKVRVFLEVTQLLSTNISQTLAVSIFRVEDRGIKFLRNDCNYQNALHHEEEDHQQSTDCKTAYTEQVLTQSSTVTQGTCG